MYVRENKQHIIIFIEALATVENYAFIESV